MDNIRGIEPMGSQSDKFMKLHELTWDEYIRVQKLIKAYQECGIDYKIKDVIQDAKGGTWHMRSGYYKPKLIIPSAGGFRGIE